MARTTPRLVRSAALGAAAGAAVEMVDAVGRLAVPTFSSAALGVVAGVCVGVATSRAREGRTIALLVIPATIVIAARAADVAERALEVFPAAHGMVAPMGAAMLGALAGVASARLTRGRFPRLRAWLCLAVGLAVMLATLAPIEEHPVAVARGAALALTVATTAWAVRARAPWPRGLGALAATVAGLVVPFGYPTVRAVLPLIALGLGLSALRDLLGRWVDAGSPSSRGLVASTLATTAVASFACERGVTHDASIWASGTSHAIGGAVSWLGRRALDVDGDGYGLAFGPADCAPMDPGRSPGRHETSGNDVDENCSGAAAGHEPGTWLRARDAVHPLPPRHRGDVLLVTVDALRYDDATAPDLPTISALAARGISYDRAYTTSTMTAMALPGLLGAELPTWFAFRFPRPFIAASDRPTRGLGDLLAQRGFGTGFAGGFDNDANPIFTPQGNLGGFSSVELCRADAAPRAVTEAATRVFAGLDPTGRRFLWVHFMWLHTRASERATYRSALRDVDEALAGLLEVVGPSALVVLTADHGEAFDEHGVSHHASTLFEEVAHVPLLVTRPGGWPARVGTVTSLRSVMPTIVAMVEPELAPSGLGPYLCFEPDACSDMDAPMALELETRHLHGLVRGPHHLIRDVGRASDVAFDLTTDPSERHPLPRIPYDAARALDEWEEHAFGASEVKGRWPYPD